MGNLLSAIWNVLFEVDKEIKLALVGLDGAGKTTIINKLIDVNFKNETAPTIGIDTKEIKIKNINVKVFDLAGQESMRNVWKYYFSSTEGIIFVIDASRQDRMADVKEELYKILQEEAAQKIPMCIYANKQDLPGALSIEQIIQELDLKDETTNSKPDALVHV